MKTAGLISLIVLAVVMAPAVLAGVLHVLFTVVVGPIAQTIRRRRFERAQASWDEHVKAVAELVADYEPGGPADWRLWEVQCRGARRG